MALAFVGESLLSTSLGVLFDRMATAGFEGMKNLFRKRKHGEDPLLVKLRINVKVVEAVLDDAENKETTNKAVKEWLDEVRDTFNQAEDLLDKINTEALRLKIETEFHQTPTNKVSASPYALPSMDKLLNDLMPEIEKIVPRLEEFQKQVQPLGLQVGESKRQSLRELSTSVVDETSVFGRDADVENIIRMLLSEDTNGGNITVVPIVGLGGIGKTTLAQMVYNDKRVKEHFSFRGWVCVSEEYDTTRITKELLREINISFSDSGENLNSLQVKLQGGLTKKKFFLVLDDVWTTDFNHWSNLRTPFKDGLRGSKIIVTTRDLNVARMMGKEESIHHLGLISEDDCWLLFEKHAFENKDGNQNLKLEEIGKEIVRKCGRLPLAVKTVAGLLRLKTTAEEWENVLISEEWNRSEGKILPSLRLSYIHLPSHLKRCFAYCAVFHKDYQFKKEEIIQLWQANDLLGYPGGNERMANWGDLCFHELRMRSLFQQSTNELFSMHDLVNDLARFVSGAYCLRLEDHQEGHGTISRISHFSYHSSDYDTYHKFQLLREAKHLKTFQPIRMDKRCAYCLPSNKFLHDMLPGFKSLRSLSLSCYNIDELPYPIVGLKQLRFLDLSYTKITNLPDWICTLCNLQTLLLSGCIQIQELPTDLSKLINLCYLDISRISSLKEMPLEMGRLRNLQVLTAFVVGKDSGSPIEELGKFPMLRGKLFLSGLENVPRSTDASMANMKGKKNLESLNLEWKGDTSGSQGVRDVFDALQPHSNIKHLEINGYCGTRFPDWLGNSSSLCNLKSLKLSSCEYCFCLPALGQLQNLQSLEIVEMSNISVLSEDLYGDTSSINPPFPSLKKFKIKKMKELEKWHIPAECEVFCGLEELCIIDCPKLTGELPKQLLSRGRVKISRCNKLVFLNARRLTSSLCELKISDEENWEELRGELKELLSLEKLDIRGNHFRPPFLSFPVSCLPASLKSLTCHYGNLELESESSWQGGTLETLILRNCDFLRDISLASFPMLKSLTIYFCKSMDKMLSIPPPRQTTSSRLTSLQHLWIWGCDDLVSFPEGGLPAPNLTHIVLQYCEKLKSLPERMESLLPSLRYLGIDNCPEIECFPEGVLPFSLQSLRISDCEKLLSRWREWGLQRLRSLRSMEIYRSHLDEVEKDLLPCTLEVLYFSNNKNLKMLNNLGHLTSLKRLQIYNCPLLESLRLPASLAALHISDCPLLKSLPEERLPASLATLCISDCPLLKSLPEERLPASLTALYIKGCPLLEPRLEWEKGQDWHKVAHIPCVRVDGKLVP